MRLSPRSATLAADAVTAQLNGGQLRLYAKGNLAPLVELQFGSPAFAPAIDGRAEAHTLEIAVATLTGMPTRFSAHTRTGQEVLTGTVGREGSGADMELTAEMVVAGGQVFISRLLYRQPIGD